MKTAGRTRRFVAFLAERFPAEKMSLQAMVQKKEVPVHRWSWAYYLGGLALFFFIIQIVTGLMMLFYYEPSVATAHASVENLTNNVPGGALIRNLHAWSSSAMILSVMLHLLTTFAMKAFGRPRELTWVSGVLLLFLVFGFGFTGYLLPWHQIAVNATKVGLGSIDAFGEYLPGALSDLPRQLRETIQGGATVGQATLSRFYAIHVIVLPLVSFGLLGLHLLSVQLHGMSPGVDKPTGRTEKFFPLFILKDLKVWGVVFLMLATVAICIPFDAFLDYPLAAPYNSLGSTPDGIKPEWYFFWMYYPLELLPFWLVAGGMAVLQVGLLLVPRIFRGTSRKVLKSLAAAAAIYLIVITLFGQAIYEMFSGGH
ncbi:MAG: cytochrome B [Deltaproteobacteria bacterium HGW-Deltaproteobacteria-14]|jgi:cytochrome b6|nr:MAG: cytochrome B [Deltaproteobacteria bacterium HGW-Deltaproteobacteria-14]